MDTDNCMSKNVVLDFYMLQYSCLVVVKLLAVS